METFYRIKEAGVKTYMLSNWMQDSYEYVQDHFIFLHDFDGGVVSYECKINKPDPAIYRLLSSRYGLDLKECLFIDDRETNLIPAAELGMDTILFTGYDVLRRELQQRGIV